MSEVVLSRLLILCILVLTLFAMTQSCRVLQFQPRPPESGPEKQSPHKYPNTLGPDEQGESGSLWEDSAN